jgi:hypothetical protein
MDRPRTQNQSAEEGAIKTGDKGGQLGQDGGGEDGNGPGTRLKWMNPLQHLIDSGQFDDYLRG